MSNITELCGEISTNEHQLKVTFQVEKSPFHPAVVSLREKLRTCYESILLTHHGYAVKHSVEQSLWKHCFYKFIEDFRMQIRNQATIISRAAKDSAAFEFATDEQTRLCHGFQVFLDSASGFYLRLISRLALRYKLQLDGFMNGTKLGFDPLLTDFGSPQVSADLRSSPRNTVHMCLIYLGDIARYAELHGTTNPKSFSLSRSYYNQAISLLPAHGSPFNQLAVLASYRNNFFEAAYLYIRAALAKANPWQTAFENLEKLFDKNNQEKALPSLPNTIDDEATQSFFRRFTHLHGILFLKSPSPTLDNFSIKARDVLDRFGSISRAMLLDPPPSQDAFSNAALLGLVTFTIASAEGLQQNFNKAEASIVRVHACTFALDFLGSLLEAATVLIDGKFSDDFLAAIKIILSWLRASTQLFQNSIGSVNLHPVWPNLYQFCMLLFKKTTQNVHRPAFNPSTWVQNFFLPEDRVLEGFAPMSGLGHMSQCKGGDASRASAGLTRCFAIVSCGILLCNTFTLATSSPSLALESLSNSNGGNGGWSDPGPAQEVGLAVEDTAKFVAHEPVLGPHMVNSRIFHDVHMALPPIPPVLNQSDVTVGSASCMDDDEDDEIVIFKGKAVPSVDKSVPWGQPLGFVKEQSWRQYSSSSSDAPHSPVTPFRVAAALKSVATLQKDPLKRPEPFIDRSIQRPTTSPTTSSRHKNDLPPAHAASWNSAWNAFQGLPEAQTNITAEEVWSPGSNNLYSGRGSSFLSVAPQQYGPSLLENDNQYSGGWNFADSSSKWNFGENTPAPPWPYNEIVQDNMPPTLEMQFESDAHGVSTSWANFDPPRPGNSATFPMMLPQQPYPNYPMQVPFNMQQQTFQPSFRPVGPLDSLPAQPNFIYPYFGP